MIEADPEIAYVTSWLRFFGDDEETRARVGAAGYAPLGNAVRSDDAINSDGDAIALMPRRLFVREGYAYEEDGVLMADWELYRRLREDGRFGAVMPALEANYRMRPGVAVEPRGRRPARARLGRSALPPAFAGARQRWVVSDGEERIADLERRVEELRRVNEQLGRELVEAEAGRRPATATPAARAVAKLVAERDKAEAELAELRPELERLWPENQALRARDRPPARAELPACSRRARARLSRP